MTAAVIGAHHFGDVGIIRVRTGAQRLERGILTGGRRTHDGVLMHLEHDPGQLLRRADKAHAPAGHGERLREAVEHNRALAHTVDGGKTRVLQSAVGQLGVNLVGNDDDVRIPQHRRNGLEISFVHHRAGRIVGIGQYQRLGARRDGASQRVRRETELILLARDDRHGHAARKDHARAVRHIARVGQKHLVARLDQHAQRHVDALARADGHEHLGFRIIAHAEARAHIVAHGLAQLDQAGVGGVVRATLPQRVDRRVADRPLRAKVRLAHAQRNGVLHRAHDVKKLAYA